MCQWTWAVFLFVVVSVCLFVVVRAPVYVGCGSRKEPPIVFVAVECLVVPSKRLRGLGMYVGVHAPPLLSIGTLHCVIPLFAMGCLPDVGG